MSFFLQQVGWGALLGLPAVLAVGTAKTCSNPVISCGTSSSTDTCCFNTPGGQIAMTQFWDTKPSTGAYNSTFFTQSFNSDKYSQDPQTRGPCMDFGLIIATDLTIPTAIQPELTLVSVRFSNLNKYWVDIDGDNESFWEHEWSKHGTCISTLKPSCYTGYTSKQEVADYFQKAVDLFKTLDSYSALSAAGIVPSTTKTYTLAAIQAALKAKFGVTAAVQCSSGALDEIWYSFYVQGSVATGKFIATNPVGASSSCSSSGIKYLPKSGSSTPPNPGGDPPPTGGSNISGSGYLNAVTSGSQKGCLIGAGTWYTTGTCATYTATASGNGVTLKSSKGSCGVVNSAFTCGSGVTATVFTSNDGHLAYSGSTTFYATAVPSGSTQATVYTTSKTSPSPLTRMPPSECAHSQLTFSPSRNTSIVKYEQPSFVARTAATTPSGTIKRTPGLGTSQSQEVHHSQSFPAPLVLPEDELSDDPKCPPQSLRSWIREKNRNKVTPERKTIYFIPPPEIGKDFAFIKEWSIPHASALGKSPEAKALHPKTRDVLDYLQAFYHGMDVKLLLTPKLEFTADSLPPSNARSRRKALENIWLNTSKELVGIRLRATPEGNFKYQLNLNDLLDVAIGVLPDDAFALVMLVEHDMFEDEEDDFCVWESEYLERICDEYEAEVGAEGPVSMKRLKGKKGEKELEAKDEKSAITGPMYAASKAHSSLPPLDLNPSPTTLYGLWLGRVCQTAGHELGHCFGIDHCVYYACSMQGTASIIEDSRQPPYLCPVDLEKVVRTTGADVLERYEAILAFCGRFEEVHLFAAYASWIREKIEEINDVVVLY
ncbi:hypothetical protein HYALB_00002360 [Hymenoscyphus albidus]|uniref:ribonuclease T2 n=1 Tax=Hymenoscyphus albidus TaxID=595503 RepID=A0A9N9Q641_9HELO|nr:hypothetical protein HYALB_00002360 [Hymenoscyphus albidus]